MAWTIASLLRCKLVIEKIMFIKGAIVFVLLSDFYILFKLKHLSGRSFCWNGLEWNGFEFQVQFFTFVMFVKPKDLELMNFEIKRHF